jgi:rhodanese-related sulfurtransferase
MMQDRYITVPQLEQLVKEIEAKQGKLQTPDLTRSKITPENTPILIIDARRPDEYAISHIPGAINIHSLLSRRVTRHLQNVDFNTPVLTYCAVGLRSGKLYLKKLNADYS